MLNTVLVSLQCKIPQLLLVYWLYSSLCCCRDTRESLERTLSQLAEVQGALERQRQEAEADTRRDREQEVKLMIDSVAAAELDNLR
jgi:hypothetical protein